MDSKLNSDLARMRNLMHGSYTTKWLTPGWKGFNSMFGSTTFFWRLSSSVFQATNTKRSRQSKVNFLLVKSSNGPNSSRKPKIRETAHLKSGPYHKILSLKIRPTFAIQVRSGLAHV